MYLLHPSIFGLVLLLWLSSVDAGAPTKCYSIPDRDRRFACIAEAKKSESGCAAIIDMDSRAMCEASASGKKNRYYKIRSKARRDSCLAGMNY